VYETLRSAGRDLVLELGERARLEEVIDELREAAQTLVDDPAATPSHRDHAGEALRLAVSGVTADRLLDLSALRCRGPRAATYEDARKRVERAALEQIAARDRDHLQTLLVAFADRYAAAKRREGVVDFEDLQLQARALLRDFPAVREDLRSRFRMVMVDEFQDTNRLQCELVDLLADAQTQRFFVGDEFQSIYGFRHADVSVFRERRTEAEHLYALTQNYRSRPEVLAAVNHLFRDEFGDEFQPLSASGEFPDPVFGHPVELLVTDKTVYRESLVHWRRGEAQLVAERIRRLVDEGAAEPGEIVVLFAAGTDAEWFEEELRRVGLPTYRGTGRGYFAQQQVADVLAYLRLLHNRYDDLALATVLASPLVGVSNDALVLLRRAAPRRPLFTSLERTLPVGLGQDDVRLLRAFRLVVTSYRHGLERLCEQILVEHDYDLAILRRWDGKRRYANLRKLGRLGRTYEALRGRDLEGFVRFVREQDELGARELEAVAEEEDADAVRLLTIHAAKGLEFKVVVVADAGRDTGGSFSPDEIVALSDGRFGFRVVHPTRGEHTPVFDYETVQEIGKRESRAERSRLYYVAMTRAIDRLIVSGSLDRSRASDWETPIGWVLQRLAAADEVFDAAGPVVEIERGSSRFVVRVDRTVREDAEAEELGDGEPPVTATGQYLLFDEIPVGTHVVAPVLAELESPVTPVGHDPRRLSYSSIALFERCSLRYWGERVAGMRPTAWSVESARAGMAETSGALHATEIGDAVHRLLEITPVGGNLSEKARAEFADLVGAWYPDVTGGELERILGDVDAYLGSTTAQRLASLPDSAAERPFTFAHDGVLLHGRLDMLARDGTAAVVVDYKTNSLGERDPHAIVEDEYSLQRAIYALACLRSGAERAEVVYLFVERPDEPVVALYGRDDVESLEGQLSQAIAEIRKGHFTPRPSPYACNGCPLLDRLCAGTRLDG
jgi:ATP-dependent exoDNAse (exonuclease V) beta subunit